MNKKIICTLLAAVLLLLSLAGCRDFVKEPAAEKNLVRIYDVEPQAREKMAARYYDQIVSLQAERSRSDPKAADMLDKLENLTFYQHERREGLFSCIDENKNAQAPYYNQIQTLEEESCVGIDYIMLGSWEQLRQELAQTGQDSTTTIILFNNTYDQSLLHEMLIGNYADLEPALENLGFYDADVYQQAVLQAGRIDGEQLMVPLLYNVSGMIHGETPLMYGGPEKLQQTYLTDQTSLDYQEFIALLNRALSDAADGMIQVPFLSPAFLEGTEPDSFLCAAGADLQNYESQKDLFRLLLEYYQTYQTTQLDNQPNDYSRQSAWAQCLNDFQYEERASGQTISAEVIRRLSITSPTVDTQPENLRVNFLARALMDQTTLFIESSTAEDIAYHSVVGLLSYRKYYNEGLSDMERAMIYCPIATLLDKNSYAAQPINYAAVLDGGNTELAAKVIQTLLHQKVDPHYGFSLNNAIKDEQLTDWSLDAEVLGHLRAFKRLDNGQYEENGSQATAYWDHYCGSSALIEDTIHYTEQLQNQLSHIIFAQIPDRELLAIWQDTLSESVQAGLTADAGFSLLCERIQAWQK